jgi:hypothetical protein
MALVDSEPPLNNNRLHQHLANPLNSHQHLANPLDLANRHPFQREDCLEEG